MEIIFALVAGGLGALFGHYAREKAKGLATREDIGDLTTIVESIKAQNAIEIAQITEVLRSQGTMRAAVLEQRMDAHQEAYRLASRMFHSAHNEDAERITVENDLRSFWLKKCLYLDASVRDAFDSAWTAFSIHRAMTTRENRFTVDQITENFDKVKALSPTIVRAISLPPIRIDNDPDRSKADPEKLIEQGL